MERGKIIIVEGTSCVGKTTLCSNLEKFGWIVIPEAIRYLEKAKEIMEVVVKNSKVPVTLKFRKGWDNEHIVATEIAKIAENAGISAITIHGRTRAEYYSGTVDLEIIKKVKENVNIPVIGNGDIVDEKSALNMFQETGCDGIMIGRAALGNPWIFEKIIHYLKTGEKLEEIRESKE